MKYPTEKDIYKLKQKEVLPATARPPVGCLAVAGVIILLAFGALFGSDQTERTAAGRMKWPLLRYW